LLLFTKNENKACHITKIIQGPIVAQQLPSHFQQRYQKWFSKASEVSRLVNQTTIGSTVLHKGQKVREYDAPVVLFEDECRVIYIYIYCVTLGYLKTLLLYRPH